MKRHHARRDHDPVATQRILDDLLAIREAADQILRRRDLHGSDAVDVDHLSEKQIAKLGRQSRRWLSLFETWSPVPAETAR